MSMNNAFAKMNQTMQQTCISDENVEKIESPINTMGKCLDEVITQIKCSYPMIIVMLIFAISAYYLFLGIRNLNRINFIFAKNNPQFYHPYPHSNHRNQAQNAQRGRDYPNRHGLVFSDDLVSEMLFVLVNRGSVGIEYEPEKLATWRYGDENAPNNIAPFTTCVICLCNFIKGEEISGLNCVHIFHSECIKRWLATDLTCPYCRVRVPQKARMVD